jgi:flagellar hook assembly protein FlgD
MTMLEQITNMANATASLASETRDARAVGMLGKTIGWTGADGIHQEGLVEAVDSSTGTPLLKVGEQLVHTSLVTDVR